MGHFFSGGAPIYRGGRLLHRSITRLVYIDCKPMASEAPKGEKSGLSGDGNFDDSIGKPLQAADLIRRQTDAGLML